jgi:glycosyltransferase involved in cell wall biosynthesis
MRIAFFSPLPPKRTGIATYSQYLSAALSEIADVHLFDTDVTNAIASSKMPVIDFARHPQFLTKLDDYDGCIYQLGNNPWYHLEIYKVLLRKPGIVVLHDTVLYYLIAGLNIGGLIKEFCLNYGVEQLDEVWKLVESCPSGDILRYKNPERYPFLKRVFDQATAIIVHSNTSKKQIQEAGYKGPVQVIPLLRYENDEALPNQAERDELKVSLGIPEGELVIGSFGFIGATKRLSSLIDALDKTGNSFRFKLLIVGEGDETQLKEQILKRGLEHKVIRAGFLRDDDFKRHLAVTDIVVNLRFPSMGETSATLIQAFSQAKPCIVTDHAWFSELPDDSVHKVAYDEREVEALAKSLLELAEDPLARERLGKRAREYVKSHCSPQKVARDYLEVVSGVALSKNTATRPGVESDRSEQSFREKTEDTRWVEEYLIGRIKALLPPQRRSPNIA